MGRCVRRAGAGSLCSQCFFSSDLMGESKALENCYFEKLFMFRTCFSMRKNIACCFFLLLVWAGLFYCLKKYLYGFYNTMTFSLLKKYIKQKYGQELLWESSCGIREAGWKKEPHVREIWWNLFIVKFKFTLLFTQC